MASAIGHSGGGGGGGARPAAPLTGLHISRSDLVLGRRIGKGSFGEVYEATYLASTTVAVKVERRGGGALHFTLHYALLCINYGAGKLNL